METTNTFNSKFETIAWGAIFILWGITSLFGSLPEGTGALGIGIILLGLNLARLWKGLPMSAFTTILGILALILGGLQFLHLSFELPIFPIILLALGAILLIRAAKK